MARKEAPEPTFEQALGRLEEIVRELEEGQGDLERSLELFEEGVGLTRLCGRKLDEAQRRIEVLMEEEGKGPRPLGLGDEEEDILSSLD